jgi:hypothetical protein
LDTYRPNLFIATERYFLVDFVDGAGQRVQSGSPAHLRATEEGMDKAISALTSRGAFLVFLETLPVGLPLRCAEAGSESRDECAMSASADIVTAEYDRLIERVAARHPSSMISIPVLDVVCPNDRCPPEVDGVVLRYDGVHFTKPGARWLAPYLYDRLKAAGVTDRRG